MVNELMKNGNRIYQVAIDVPLRKCFDYLAPKDFTGTILRGTRVKVPFGRQNCVGLVLGQSDETQVPLNQLKEISEIFDPSPLFPENLCVFIEKTAQYYHHPIGEVAVSGVPTPIRQGKTLSLGSDHPSSVAKGHELDLNSDQQIAIEAILAKDQFQTFLLDGITGSGKTEIYLQACAHMLAMGKSVLVLVPEISLTPQTEQRFRDRFNETVVCYHSRMTPKARGQAWMISRDKTCVVVGTRSAIFLPFQNLGLIVVDEEHDPSFKQQEGFRYSARDCAILRAKILNCPCVLGSATPSFESLFNAKNQKYQWLRLRQRAQGNALPEVTLLDARHKKLEGGLSAPVLAAIETHCRQNGQVLLFINRRGFAPTFMCYGCGFIAQCKKCDARLTYHQKQQLLICHHCLSKLRPFPHCPECNGTELHPVGQGTERLEGVLQEHFPQFSIARIDSDVARKKGALEDLLTKASRNEIQILIGTQILAKGHHFPHLSLVAVVDADGGLFSVDFRSIERMAQLMIQVAGRAGRVHQAGKVLIQTFHPEHPLLKTILKQDYAALADQILEDRARHHLPPYTHLALIRAHSKDPDLSPSLLKEIQTKLSTVPKVSVLGPVPAPMLKRQNHYHYQLLIQSFARKPLHQVLSYSTSLLEQSKLNKRVRWSLDVDPIEMF